MRISAGLRERSASMRKLAVAAFSFSIAIFLSNYLLPQGSILLSAVLCAVVGSVFLILRHRRLLAPTIALIAAAAGFLVFAVHYDLTVEKAHELAGEHRTVSFQVISSPTLYETYSGLETRVISDDIPHLRCIVYGSRGDFSDISSGDLISAEVKLSAADIRYDKSTDRYITRDIYLSASVKGEVTVIGHRHSLRSAASELSGRLCRVIDRVFPADTAPFLKALMVGYKTDLYKNDSLYVSLSRSGLMHVVAVSGMHVSFVVGFLQLIVGKGKKSAFLCIPLIWLFVLISGMPPSALRAAFMQTLLLIAPLFGRETDALTSLSAALAALLLVNPFCAGSVSLQLSFSAMLGIVLFAERIQETVMQPFGDGIAATVIRIPAGIISCSLSVMVFTIPVSAVHFGYIAALSVLSNLLCLWAVPICFVGGYVTCLISPFSGIARIAAGFVSFLTRYLYAVCRLVASLPYASVSLPDGLMAVWVLIVYAVIATAFLIKLKPVLKIALPFVTAGLLLIAFHELTALSYSRSAGTVTAVDVGQGQCVCTFAADSTVMIDCGSISYAEYNAGECAANYLDRCGREQIDLLVFTHLHADHANGFERLSNLIKIKKVLIPVYADMSDDVLADILSCSATHGIEVEYVFRDETESFDAMSVAMLAPAEGKNENERCMVIIVSIDGYDVLITGDSTARREKELAEEMDLGFVDVVIVGHHGSKSSSCEELLEEIGGEMAVISVGSNNYGHPAQDTLARLEACGFSVWRTDRDGNVEIRLNG